MVRLFRHLKFCKSTVYVEFFLAVPLQHLVLATLIHCCTMHSKLRSQISVGSSAKNRVRKSTSFWPLESMTRPSPARAGAQFTKKYLVSK
jgi:hypothetical protein